MANYLLYDGECRICTLLKGLLVWVGRGRVRGLTIGEARRRGLLDQLPPEKHYASFHLVSRGRVYSGEAALPWLLGLVLNLSWLPGLIGRLIPLYYLLGLGYRVLVGLRSRASCRLP